MAFVIRDYRCVACSMLRQCPIWGNGERSSEKVNGVASMLEIQRISQKENTMKIVFSLPALVDGLLPKTVDRKRLIEACESDRNKMVIDVAETKGERKMRLTGSAKQIDAQRAQERLNIREVWNSPDKATVVHRFIAYCDEVRVCAERVAKFNGLVHLIALPEEFNLWIAKFDTATPKVPKVPKAPKNGNGEVEAEPANRVAELVK